MKGVINMNILFKFIFISTLILITNPAELCLDDTETRDLFVQGPTFVTLYGGQTIDLGYVEFSIDYETEIFSVTYVIPMVNDTLNENQWRISEIHLWVGVKINNSYNYPQGSNGNLRLGLFPYQLSEENLENNLEILVEIPLSEIHESRDFNNTSLCDYLCGSSFLEIGIISHASVYLEGRNGSIIQQETAYGNGTSILSSGSWATITEKNIVIECIMNPTEIPTISPSLHPTVNPTNNPTSNPTSNPTINPTINPTTNPTSNPTNNPTNNPTSDPTSDPTSNPTSNPTNNPTETPTNNPTQNPTSNPTNNPTDNPTINPTSDPTNNPTNNPTSNPTNNPTEHPTNNPSENPTSNPSSSPKSSCETAYSFSNESATCFIDDFGDNNRWGWTNGPYIIYSLNTTSESQQLVNTIQYNLYGGAGQCDLDNGIIVGVLEITLNEEENLLTFTAIASQDFVFDDGHFYIGETKYNIVNGEYNIANGQFPYIAESGEGSNIDGTYIVISFSIDIQINEFYFIFHVSACPI